MPRTFAEIDADLAAVRAEMARLARMHADLTDERKTAMPDRDAAFVRAFDAGRAVKQIAHDHATTINTVWRALRKSGRTGRSRGVPISHLPAPQQRAYHKAVAHGIGPAAARQLAIAVPA